MLLSLPLAAAFSAEPAALIYQSARGQAALLELYSSEGCSSCPPAEAWLSKLKDHPGLWKDFVPVAFHVDYWDYLGWRDPWAKAAFSERQRRYAAAWRNESVYTPGFVLNGKEWRNWGDQGVLKLSGQESGVLTVSSADTNRWTVTFVPVKLNEANYEAHVALLGSGLASDVKAGENRGRRLNHDFAVVTLLDFSLTRNGDAANGEFVLPARRNLAGNDFALAVWVTRARQLEPLQATGGWLVPAGSHR